jgi:elongation factor P
MISTNDFRTGVTIEIDGDAYQVVDFQHVKPGKGSAFVRSKLKNVRTGAVVEKTFAAGEKLPKAHLERKEMQYLYHDGESFILMDVNNFEQMPLSDEQVGEGKKFLKENMNLLLQLIQSWESLNIARFAQMLLQLGSVQVNRRMLVRFSYPRYRRLN